MIRIGTLTLLACTICNSAFAHFIFIVPQNDSTALKVVMSESLEADDAVQLGPLTKLKLNARSIDGKTQAIDLKPYEHHLTGPAAHRQIVFGSLDYGISNRGGKAILLRYHPKAIIDSVPVPMQRLANVPAEIVPERDGKGGVRFLVLFNDVKVADAEVAVLTPDGSPKKVKTDSEGFTPTFSAPGRYGLWARVIEEKAGEHQGEKYEQIRHYPTLVIDYTVHPPLPEAVSSIGAATVNDAVYVYGGHRAKVHSYDKQAVTGAWRRLNLTQPAKWDELPAGPPVQGLALVAYQGKLIRIGGMAPENAAGAKSDTRSTASCGIFDPATGAWRDFPAMPKPRSSHDSVVIGDTLLVVGGWNMRGPEGDDWDETMLTLDLRHPEAGWKSLPQPFHRRALQAGVYRNKMYVAGGLDDDDAIVGSVDVYDPASNQWSKAPELPGGHRVGFNPGICSANGKLYVSVNDGTVASLSADEKTWDVVAKLAPRVVHRMVPAGSNGLLLIGGASRGENLDTVEFVNLQR